MTNVRRLLPRLTVNRRLLQAVVDERHPCCALGPVEERRRQFAAILLGLPQVEDLAQLGDGIRVGHQVAHAGLVQALRLDFAFTGLAPLQVVLDPTNITVHRVLAAIVEADAYFVLVVGAHGLTAFRAEVQDEDRRLFGDVLRLPPAVTPRLQNVLAILEEALRGRAASAARLLWIGDNDPSLVELPEDQRYELRPAP